jgi:hypothetical protein
MTDAPTDPPQQAVPEEAHDEAMEIHKPKAAHSWREFAIEIGTIICGILIALSLEQGVEWLRHTTEVRETREALREEIKSDAAIAQQGLEEDRCLQPQFAAFAAWARGGPKPTNLRNGLPGMRSSTWDTVKGAAAAHMPLKERLALGLFYDMVDNQTKLIDAQRSGAGSIRAIEERDRLDPVDAGRLLEAVALERTVTGVHTYNARTILGAAAGMGIKPDPLDPGVRQFLAWECGHGDTPVAKDFDGG